MISLFKDIILIIYLKVFSIYFGSKRTRNKSKPHLMFINTEQIGDLIISSLILEKDMIFCDYEKVYYLIKEEYSDLFLNYTGRIIFVPINIIKFKISFFYNIKICKYLTSLNIDEVYNISPVRGPVNEILSNVTLAANKYTISKHSIYLSKHFINYWNSKYTKILFSNVPNYYSQINDLVSKFTLSPVNSTNTFLGHTTYNVVDSPYVSVSPYSSNSLKNWSVNNYKKLISILNSRIKIIILCSPDQKDIAHKDFSDMTNVEIAKTKLSNVSDIIANSELYIGNDSGLTHLAIKLGVKTIAVIGGGSYGRFFPIPDSDNTTEYVYNKLECFGCEWKCIYSYRKCLVDINYENVLKMVKNKLETPSFTNTL